MVKYNSNKNKLGWIVEFIGFIYFCVFMYYSYSNNLQAQAISGAATAAILVIGMLIFKLTKYTGGKGIY